MRRLLRFLLICSLAACCSASYGDDQLAAGGRFPLIERAIGRIQARVLARPMPPDRNGQLVPQGDPLANQAPAADRADSRSQYRPLFQRRATTQDIDSQPHTVQRVPTLAPPRDLLRPRVPTLAPPRQSADHTVTPMPLRPQSEQPRTSILRRPAQSGMPTLAPPKPIKGSDAVAIDRTTSPVRQATSILVAPGQVESPERAGGIPDDEPARRVYSGPREF